MHFDCGCSVYDLVQLKGLGCDINSYEAATIKWVKIKVLYIFDVRNFLMIHLNVHCHTLSSIPEKRYTWLMYPHKLL